MSIALVSLILLIVIIISWWWLRHLDEEHQQSIIAMQEAIVELKSRIEELDILIALESDPHTRAHQENERKQYENQYYEYRLRLRKLLGDR